MQRKKSNLYYGVSVDGLSLKIAEIEVEHNKTIIKKIDSFKLETPLFSEIMDDSSFQFDSNGDSDNQEFSFSKPENKDVNLDDIDIFSEDADVSNDNLIQTDIHPDPVSELTTDSLLRFIGQFDLVNGKISLSCLEGKAQWKLIRLNKKANVKELKKLALSAEQIKDSSYNYDFIQNPDKSYYVVIHQGDFELMTLLNNSADTIYNKKKLYYQFIEPIEVSILNVISVFYDVRDDLYTTILYIGNEAKLGIVVNGKRIVKNFPIMIYDTNPVKVREAVYAKIMLEQESSEIPIIENMILCGDYATEEDLNFYNEKTGNTHSLFTPMCPISKKNVIDIEISEGVPIEQLPAFIVPLSLAIKGSMPNYKDFRKFNLLPRKIIESQKVFKIEWHGFLILFLLFIITFLGTNTILKNRLKLDQLKARYAVTGNEINTLKNFQSLLQGYSTQIDFYNKMNAGTASIANEKNSWSEILYTFADFTNRNPLCWIENLSYNDKKILIKGKSYHRNRITNLAKLFENGEISRINENSISGSTVWDYDISFTKPKGNLPENIPLPGYLKNYDDFLKWYELEYLQKPAKVIVSSPAIVTPIVKNNIPQSRQDKTVQSFMELYDEARDNYLSANFDTTIRNINIIIEQYPNHKDIDLAYYLLGETYYVLSEFDQATKHFENVIKLDRNKLPETHFFLAKSYEALADYEKAIITYTKLIQLYPQNSLSKTAGEQLKNLLGEYE